MAHSTFTLTGKHTSPAGAAHVGSVKVTPNAVIRDVAGALVMAGPDIVKLDASGAWSLVLPCDSPGLNPATGIGFTVEYLFRAESLEPQSFYATADLAGSTVDAASLVTTTVARAVTTTIGPQIGTATDGTPYLLPGDPGAVSPGRRVLTEAGMLKARAKYLDLYNSFFGGATGSFVTGQLATGTTLTATAAAGATVLAVASAAGMVAGANLVANAGAADEQRVRVVSVAGSNVTVTPALTAPIAAGAAVDPLWSNSSHLSYQTGSPQPGYASLARYIANAQDGSGYLIAGAAPKVAMLGNSWFAQGGTAYATAIQARIPGSTVVNAGVSGNTTAQMLARFATDVPADSTHVVLFESVNDISQGVTPAASAANWQALIAKVLELGATPIVASPPPLSDYANETRQWAAIIAAIVGDGAAFYPKAAAGLAGIDLPLVKIGTANVSNYGIGVGALNSGRVTGANNIGVGWTAGAALTTGSDNTVIGQQAGDSITTGTGSTAVGRGALGAATTANANTAVGKEAGLSVTGQNNTYVGHQSGQQPNFAAANASTTGTGQTVVGAQSGQGTPTPANFITTLGYRTTASHAGSAAIGTDSSGAGATTTAANQVALGTASHTVAVPGRLNVATRTPTSSADAQGTTGDIAWDDSFLYVKTSTGWKRSALTAF